METNFTNDLKSNNDSEVDWGVSRSLLIHKHMVMTKNESSGELANAKMIKISTFWADFRTFVKQ